MKKNTALFLLFLVMLSSSPQNQGVSLIVKTGAFVHHFIHHVSCQDEKIGLADFISLHYFDHEHHEEDHEEHENLPFSHQHGENKPNLLPIILFLTELHNLAFFDFEYPEKEYFFYQEWLPSRVNFNIWKPPRFEV